MKKLRVAQCWDDGVFTDIRLTEILKKYNAKATFNLCSGLISEKSVETKWYPLTKEDLPSMQAFFSGRVGLDRLREVYSGFEVASHCDLHENAQKVEPQEFLRSAVKCREFLEDFFQKECRGFAWPYGTHTDETADLLKKAGFAYGRTVSNTKNVLDYKDPLRLDSSCHFMNRNFWNIYNDAKENSGVFYFWGHSYEMMDYERYWQTFEFIISTISSDPDAEWVNVVDLV